MRRRIGHALHWVSDELHLLAHRIIGDPDWRARNGDAVLTGDDGQPFVYDRHASRATDDVMEALKRANPVPNVGTPISEPMWPSTEKQYPDEDGIMINASNWRWWNGETERWQRERIEGAPRRLHGFMDYAMEGLEFDENGRAKMRRGPLRFERPPGTLE